MYRLPKCIGSRFMYRQGALTFVTLPMEKIEYGYKDKLLSKLMVVRVK